ncbi:DUF2182 domain-containing protein [Colwellia psychrerythraea]|uniref:Metal-binding integral membrane protein n=1 Tax=Colwellia psychrerythraea TaxID=28229 RepID=A0A099KPX1_COLPS|nr:DUF2182 domain-containing protein [Colwellia psychrerythraea]KGJ92265.1 Protein of unknown function DUF2182, transmembrane, metal-binding protein [Colwellia psychrerythraea]
MIRASHLVKHWPMFVAFAIISVAWYYIFFIMKMNMSPVAQWDYVDVILLFIMWAIMMAAMMLPSALPIFHLIEKINHQREARNAAYSSSIYFILGYLLAWLCYSFAITLLQWWFHHLALLTPMMKSAQLEFTCLILLLAGVYQWLPIKQRCLNHCRSPLGFITSSWQEGAIGTFKMGVSHGQYCLGCCWILMALLLVFGVMNLLWIIALTFIVFIEKLVPNGVLFSKILGVLLILSSMWLFIA